MNKFVQYTESAPTGRARPVLQAGLVMDYFDGNTVTGLWDYAQNYAMSDNNYHRVRAVHARRAQSGSGNTGASYAVSPTDTNKVVADPGTVSALNSDGLGTIYGGAGRRLPTAPTAATPAARTPSPWGYRPVRTSATCSTPGTSPGAGSRAAPRRPAPTPPVTRCAAPPPENIAGATVQDYVPHHDPFQYYKSTANPKHLPPTSEAAIGHTDQANHQYDISLFADRGQVPEPTRFVEQGQVVLVVGLVGVPDGGLESAAGAWVGRGLVVWNGSWCGTSRHRIAGDVLVAVPHTAKPAAFVPVGANPPWNQPQVMFPALSRLPMFGPVETPNGKASCRVAAVGAVVVRGVEVAVDRAEAVAVQRADGAGSGTLVSLSG